jgi:hypothetical protein|tara:strand:- start:3837 stop:4637 length:801 start_codon:yes stop_codon:yes gene_type:complete
MKIYDSLKDVLSVEQLDEFKAEVQNTIDEKVLSETSRIEKKAEEYVELVVEEKTETLTQKAEEYIEIQLSEAKEEIIKEYDEKLEEMESTVVESLDRFLDNEISEKISDELVEAVAIDKQLLPLVNGIKSLFENNYVSLDTEGHSMLAKLSEEKEELEEKLSESIADKMELSELAEKAATELLIKQKSDELSIAESEKVESFFEGKSFDEVSEKIDNYIGLIQEEATSYAAPVLNEDLGSDEGIEDVKPSVKPVNDMLAAASKFMY